MNTGNTGSSYIAPLETSTYTWRIEGVTPAHFAAAKVGDRMFSPEFEACGHS